MSAATTAPAGTTLSHLFQYTVETYKMFQKLSELLPNPMAAHTFENLAEDEREMRDLIEIRYSDPSVSRTKVSLENDLRYQDALEGDLAPVELLESLIVREKTMEKQLTDAAKSGEAERNLFLYIAAAKRAHVVYLQREVEMLRLYPDWNRREDAEALVVHGDHH